MRRPLIAIGLDSVDHPLLERLMKNGGLPNIRRLHERGTLALLSNRAHYEGGCAPQSITEGCWSEFLTGVRTRRTGYWSSLRYDPTSYEVRSDRERGGYDYREFPPFYARKELRVATLDLPVSTLHPQVNGLQVAGWGGHFPFVIRGSRPAELFDEINDTYGSNEILYEDSGVFWNETYLDWLERASIDSARTRTRLCLDLLQRERWDLFLAVFSETHGALHDLWFASDSSHPLHHLWQKEYDPLARVFTAIDEGIGAIVAHVPDNASFALFSVNGSGPNIADAAAFFLLPELLYRFNFPGRIGFSCGDPALELAAPIETGRRPYWFGEIWSRVHAKSRWRRRLNQHLPAWLVTTPSRDLRYPYFMDVKGAECGWMPSTWYAPAWPRMRAFALPSFADGHFRINLTGREASGVVLPEAYDDECDRVMAFLRRVRHGRTGRPFIIDAFRTRKAADDEDPRYPSADVIAIFENSPVDVVDSPEVGRVGPVPYYRTGGHTHSGFLLTIGPEIRAGGRLPEGEAVDLTPTMLQLLGKSIPDWFDGHSLLDGARR